MQELLDAVVERPPDHGITLALAVLVDGELAGERYGTAPANDWSPTIEVDASTPLTSWSMAKSITHAAIGVLVDDGKLDLDAPAPVPQWAGTDKEHITLLDLLEMRPGLRFVEDYVDGEVSHCLTMLFGEGADDHAAYAAALPLDHEPGTVWNYSSGTTNILCGVIGDVITGRETDAARRADLTRAWLRERLFGPTGMTTATPHFDRAGNWVGSSYVDASARDFAKFGELYRNDGLTADGIRVLPTGWADHGRTFVAHDPESDWFPNEIPGGLDYGRHWWMLPAYPGSIVASGYEGQMILVVPDRKLTIVHLGKTPVEVRHHLMSRILDIVDAV